MTAQEAYRMWKTDPEWINIIEVRTREKYVFVGHPEMTRDIHSIFVKHQLDADNNALVMEPIQLHLPCEGYVCAHRHAPGHVPIWGP